MTIPEPELYENNLYYFREVLSVLAADATTQCKRLWGAPNVPWELSHDVMTTGSALLAETEGRVLPEQRQKIEALIAAMKLFPSRWRENKLTFEQNLKALQDPFWAPLRATATALLAELPYIDKDSFTT